jgi:hypothetical protein
MTGYQRVKYNSQTKHISLLGKWMYLEDFWRYVPSCALPTFEFGSVNDLRKSKIYEFHN